MGLCYNTGMTVETVTVQFGQAITFDGGQWGEIVNASGDTVWVLDEDGVNTNSTLTGWTSLKKEKIKLAFSPNLC